MPGRGSLQQRCGTGVVNFLLRAIVQVDVLLPSRRNSLPDPRSPHEAEEHGSRAKLPRTAGTRLGACTAAAALLQLDGTLITVALPAVVRNLHTTTAFTSLLLSAYFAAYAL